MMRPLFFIAGALTGLALSLSGALAAASHGLSAFGDLKYPGNFKHFDYVNPAAPKGGRMVTMGTGAITTFDSFNSFILKGDAAQKLDLLFDSLMVRALDEPDAVYGLVAESADLADDRMSVTFKMRPEAKFADGSPVTSADVVTSFELLKTKGHPVYRIRLKDVEKAEALDAHTVRYSFTGSNVRDLPMLVASLPILSKAYYTENDFSQTSLKPPLGSGPYRIKDFKQGQYITYALRDDYWAKDLPVNAGRYNFGEIQLLYFRDQTPAREALKAGEMDLREEFHSKAWATEYDIPAVKEKRLIIDEPKDFTVSGGQGFFINMRRKKFQDKRVREALDHAFDFEWTRANLFYGQYERTTSFFENSNMKASGKPDAAQSKLLEPYREKLDPEVFDEPYVPPVSSAKGQDRKMLRRASQLLSAAGWKRDGTVLKNASGETLDVEFLITNSGFERIINPFIRNLKLLGINASLRVVEAAQYQERLKRFDYDLTVSRFNVDLTPGTNLNSFFSSQSASTDGSYNLSGIKNPAVDGLINAMTQAATRDELTVAAKALDRVLRAERLWVSNWYNRTHRLAYWDIFGKPAIKPKYDRGVFDTWWIDAAKAASIKRGK